MKNKKNRDQNREIESKSRMQYAVSIQSTVLHGRK